VDEEGRGIATEGGRGREDTGKTELRWQQTVGEAREVEGWMKGGLVGLWVCGSVGREMAATVGEAREVEGWMKGGLVGLRAVSARAYQPLSPNSTHATRFQ
jgi:hypothetical protein